ncbi:hypothetical protein [Hymenobacter armeniacus]|uniref:MarR family transcriptional regulator n=1 Tax=Hymenobacter armeniacus TaxID=2771358 RepID=A0ABR8JTZ8_9BACT|nr:hypothetical protein [Hymenobacter armeniacus]MBD2722236.1 hypothetical protein [Hymenobacter armeniacus]
MPDTPVLPEDAPGLADQFAARLALRDNPGPPPPPSQAPEAIAARVAAWLGAQHDVGNRRGRAALSAMLLVLVQQPDAATADLQAASGLGPRMAARATRRLEALGLTEWFYRSRTRFHRLTRAGEDALLPVVAGRAG